MKKLFFLMTCLFASLTMSAESVTLSFAGGNATNQDPIEFTDAASGISAVFTAGNHSTKPRWDASCVRFYGTATMSNVLTVSAPAGGTITSIDFAMNGSYSLTKVTADAGSISGTTWTGSAESVKFSTTAQTRIEGVTITYTAGGAVTPVPSLRADASAIDFGSIEEGGAFEAQTLTVTGENLTAVPAYDFEGAFDVTGDLTAEGGDLTITCTATAIGEYTGRLLISGDGIDVEVALSATIKEKFVLGEGEELLATIEFKSTTGADGSAAKTAIADLIETGAEHVSAIPTASKIYNGKNGYGIKGGTGSAKGELTLTLAKRLDATKIVVNAAAYGSDETTLLVNEQELSLTSELTDYTITVSGGLSDIVIAAQNASKNRFYVKSLTIYGTPAKEVAATAITLDKSELTLNQYYAETLVATIEPADATTAIEWSSSNACVSVEGGVVKALAEGTATITATAGSVSATCEVTVVGAPDPLTFAYLAGVAVAPEETLTLTGYVTRPQSEGADIWNSDYSNATFYLADDKDGVEDLLCFRAIPSVEGQKPAVGDEVKIVGTISFYNNVPQFAQGATYTVVKTATALENAAAEAVKAVKVIENGQLVIMKDGVRYNVLGTVIE